MDNQDFRDLIADRLRTLRCERHFDTLYRMGRFAELKYLAKRIPKDIIECLIIKTLKPFKNKPLNSSKIKKELTKKIGVPPSMLIFRETLIFNKNYTYVFEYPLDIDPKTLIEGASLCFNGYFYCYLIFSELHFDIIRKAYVRQQTSHFSDSNEFEKYKSCLIRDEFEEVLQ